MHAIFPIEEYSWGAKKIYFLSMHGELRQAKVEAIIYLFNHTFQWLSHAVVSYIYCEQRNKFHLLLTQNVPSNVKTHFIDELNCCSITRYPHRDILSSQNGRSGPADLVFKLNCFIITMESCNKSARSCLLSSSESVNADILFKPPTWLTTRFTCK